MTSLRRRMLLRVVTAAAAGVVAISLARRCEQSADRDITVEVDVQAVPDVRTARIELWRGTTIVAWLDRRLDGGMDGPIRLRGPALGAGGEVRIVLDTADGVRRLRRPLVAPAGSEVLIRCGADQP